MAAVMQGQGAGGVEYRYLAPQDLPQVVAIDARILDGPPRRAYFERKLAAALAQPKLHIQYAATSGGALVGYVLARCLQGEFGRDVPALRLSVLGVAPGEQHHGVGLALVGLLEDWARRHGIAEIRSQARWRDHRMLAFFDRAGFDLGRNHVIDCEVHAGPLAAGGSDEPLAADPSAEVDWSAPAPNDFEALPRDRVDVRILRRDDLSEIRRIDRRLTGRDRGGYLEQVVDEALGDSGVRVSLVARVDGIVRGFVMAKTDFGDFGRAEPVAVIDTIGVDPDTPGRGIGSALLSQLFVNLQALHVERVETIVSRDNLDLLGFFYRSGFNASERLGLVKRLGRAEAQKR